MKVLVCVAHPDDEIIGVGGSIIKHLDKGHTVKITSLTTGEGSRSFNNCSERIDMFKNVMSFLGVNLYNYHDLPDNEMDKLTYLQIIKLVENDFLDFSPNIVYTHSSTDLNIDHQITNRIIQTIFRPLPNSSVEEIREFETPSATGWYNQGNVSQFHPNLYIDISSQMDRKIKALKLYNAELRKYPHVRSLQSIQNHAQYRGNSIGLNFAEAFNVTRRIC